MIPVLGVPYINRSDLFVRLITSINHPVNEIVVIDNSDDESLPIVEGAKVIKAHRNMGVSWAWNTIIMATPHARWWAIVNSDIKLGEGDLANLEAAMQDHEIVRVGSLALFGISASCIQKVGWFDENFVPAYCEDNDYVYRCHLLGVDAVNIDCAGTEHYGSAAIRSDPKKNAGNGRSYPMNVKYYQEKWGGLMGHEVFKTPFDKGGSPRECPPLDFDRLRALSWD